MGTTCIYLLTGVSPFELFDISEYCWVWQQYLVDNSVSDKLSNILDKLIENATSRRYQSVNQVLQDTNYQSNLTFDNTQSVSYRTPNKKSNSIPIKTPNKISNFAPIQTPNKISTFAPIKPFNYSSFRCINTLTSHFGSINSVAISSDGKILASGSHDSKIKLWNLHAGSVLQKLDNDNSVYAVALSPYQRI